MIFPETQGKQNFTMLPKKTQKMIRQKYNDHNDYVIIDEVKVPKLPSGRYVLSWRWDAEQTAQVWTNCAVIEIVQPGSETAKDGHKSELKLDALSETASQSQHTAGWGVGVAVVAVGALGVAALVARNRVRKHPQQHLAPTATIAAM